MLGKLIKYDILADWKKYCLIYASALVLSAVCYALDSFFSNVNNNLFLVLTEALLGTALMVMIAASAVMTVVFTVMRFYKNLMRDEGYLMHTLPVPTWQLLASKLITFYIWCFAAVIAVVICIGIVMGEPLWVFNILGELPEILEGDFYDAETAGAFKAFIGYMLATIALTPLFFAATIYLSFALGNLSNTHKLGMSVLMFFAINAVEQIVSQIIMQLTAPDFLKWALSAEQDAVPDAELLNVLNRSLIMSIILSVIISAGYLIAAERIFSKKLNLE